MRIPHELGPLTTTENELKFKETKQPSQGQAVSEWQSPNLNPKPSDLRAQTLKSVREKNIFFEQAVNRKINTNGQN